MGERKESAKARRDFRQSDLDGNATAGPVSPKSRPLYLLEYMHEVPEHLDTRPNSFQWFQATHHWYNHWHTWKRYRTLDSALQGAQALTRKFYPLARIVFRGEVLHRFGYEEVSDRVIRVTETGRLLALDIDFAALYNQSVPGMGIDL